MYNTIGITQRVCLRQLRLVQPAIIIARFSVYFTDHVSGPDRPLSQMCVPVYTDNNLGTK